MYKYLTTRNIELHKSFKRTSVINEEILRPYYRITRPEVDPFIKASTSARVE